MDNLFYTEPTIQFESRLARTTSQKPSITIANPRMVDNLRYRSFSVVELKVQLKKLERALLKDPRRTDLKLETMELRQAIKRFSNPQKTRKKK